MSINRVTITGNLTRDPELRTTASGTQVLAFGVAVNDRAKNGQTGQWEDRPNFIDCTMFGNRAQALSPHIHKGSKVAIEGKLRWSQWSDAQTGQKRSKLEVVVDDLEFMDARGHQSQPQPVYGAQPQEPAVGAQPGAQAGYTAYRQSVQAVQQAQPVYATEDISF